ncbi:hypothetical protein GCM10010178_10150 [Lentzea flava]|nr:hypothetical protein GCM10010178_10150 [Lentzea flava]
MGDLRKYPPGGCRITPRSRTLEERKSGKTEDAMLSVVFTWAAAVVGLLVLALMALSGVMIDSQR